MPLWLHLSIIIRNLPAKITILSVVVNIRDILRRSTLTIIWHLSILHISAGHLINAAGIVACCSSRHLWEGVIIIAVLNIVGSICVFRLGFF